MSRSLRLALFFTAASLVAPAALAQVCSGVVVLASQGEVDAFDCAEVTGDLAISGGDITDLTPLAGLTSVGSLGIEANPVLVTLAGLEDLTSVGGLYIGVNPVLVSLAGLEGLTSVVQDGVTISGNAALTSLAGLEDLTSAGNLYIDNNDALTSLTGLEGLTSVGDYVAIQDNDALTSLAGLEDLTSVGSLGIGGNAVLTSLAGLESLTTLGGSLGIGGNAVLTSLAGLDNLTFVPGSLFIRDNTALTSLAGLENVTVIEGACLMCNGGLEIRGNPALTSLAGLGNLTSIGRGLYIVDNVGLTSLAGLEDLTSVGENGLDIEDNAALTDCACGLGGLISGDPLIFSGVNGEVIINANALGGQCTSPEVVLDDFATGARCMPVASEPAPGGPDSVRAFGALPEPVPRYGYHRASPCRRPPTSASSSTTCSGARWPCSSTGPWRRPTTRWPSTRRGSRAGRTSCG